MQYGIFKLNKKIGHTRRKYEKNENEHKCVLDDQKLLWKTAEFAYYRSSSAKYA